MPRADERPFALAMFGFFVIFMSDMKNGCRVNIAGRRGSGARDLEAALREAGFDAKPDPDGRIVVTLEDGFSVVAIPWSAGNGRPAEAAAAQALIAARSIPGIPVLTARRFTPGAIQALRASGLSFVDDQQFVFRCREPFILIDRARAGGKVGPGRQAMTGLGGQLGVVVQVLLLEDERAWQVTEVADLAGVSVGTAQNALRRMEQQGMVRTAGAGPSKRRWVTDRGRLLDEWAAQAGRERRTMLSGFVFAQGSEDLAGRVSRALAAASVAHGVTGSFAARLLAPHVTAAPVCEVWVGAQFSPEVVLTALGSTPEARGANVRVLRGRTDAALFRAHETAGVAVVNDLRVYADLLVDPQRGEEQAAFLREQRLAF